MIQEKVFFGGENKLVGVLTLPSKFLINGKKYPAVIFCHGFAQGMDGKVKGGKFTQIARALASRGIASLRFDFSGHGESYGIFEDLSILKESDDLLAAYNSLRSDSRIDMTKITIIGHSLGALVAVVNQAKHKLAKNLILLSPAIQQKELIKRPNWFSEQELALWKQNGFLDFRANNKDLRVGSAYLNEVEKINWCNLCKAVDCPVSIIYGENDKYIPLDFVESLPEAFGGQCELNIIPDADHHFEGEMMIKRLAVIILKFLRER